MSIDPNENRIDFVLSAYEPEMSADKGIARAMAALPQPIQRTPHSAEAWVKPTLARADSLRDRARVWAPAIASTVIVAALLVGPVDVPMTGPLIAYAMAWLAFGWWTAAGRPGPRDTALLLVRAAMTTGRGIGIATVAVVGVLRRAMRLLSRAFRRVRRIRVRRIRLQGA
ncbi:hypothetical protein [Nocardia salmonicida]|uniref:hypothetical protein n=1 Tax=Nocardia salmonicida TaxID=53431 RepID=UPI0007A3B89B|nr:hypothetical protein [Nocardia salmonicida]